ncbi:MAG: flagellar hook-length control protein FliK [Thiotrichales bacterium]|nr:flagellar hook-length control protein FliK [Thiotrichales bacterium]
MSLLPLTETARSTAPMPVKPDKRISSREDGNPSLFHSLLQAKPLSVEQDASSKPPLRPSSLSQVGSPITKAPLIAQAAAEVRSHSFEKRVSPHSEAESLRPLALPPSVNLADSISLKSAESAEALTQTSALQKAEVPADFQYQTGSKKAQENFETQIPAIGREVMPIATRFENRASGVQDIQGIQGIQGIQDRSVVSDFKSANTEPKTVSTGVDGLGRKGTQSEQENPPVVTFTVKDDGLPESLSNPLEGLSNAVQAPNELPSLEAEPTIDKPTTDEPAIDEPIMYESTLSTETIPASNPSVATATVGKVADSVNVQAALVEPQSSPPEASFDEVSAAALFEVASEKTGVEGLAEPLPSPVNRLPQTATAAAEPVSGSGSDPALALSAGSDSRGQSQREGRGHSASAFAFADAAANAPKKPNRSGGDFSPNSPTNPVTPPASGQNSQASTSVGMETRLMAPVSESLRSGLEQTKRQATEEAQHRSVTLSPESTQGLTPERRSVLPAAMLMIPLPMRHPQWGQAFGQRIGYMIHAQVQQAQITVNPEKLGPIHIKLQFDQDQQLQLTVLTQAGSAREAVEASLPRLKEILEQAGIDLGSMNLGSQDSSSQAHQSPLEKGGQPVGLGWGEEHNAPQGESLLLPNVAQGLVDFYA